MTLPELCEFVETPTNTMHPNTQSAGDIGQAVKTVLQQAAMQGRAFCSLESCVDVLSTRPDDVMLCVMPVLSNGDAGANIQSTLIRAVCHEHSIPVVSVDCDVKLAKTVCFEEDENCNNVLVNANLNKIDNANIAKSVASSDSLALGFPCALVLYPSEAASEADEKVVEFCKEHMYGLKPKEPYVELPE